MSRTVIVVGDGEGLGNAVARSVLRYRAARVIGVSRRSQEQVVGLAELTAAERHRFFHLAGDLTVQADRARVCSAIASRLEDEGSSLASIVLACGTGYLDTELEEKPPLREGFRALNVDAPCELVERLAGRLEGAAPIIYFSGLHAHPHTRTPLLIAHKELKQEAAERLEVTLPGRLRLVMPGTYDSAMVRHSIMRRDAMLEWFTMPLSRAEPRRGLARVVAQAATSPVSSVEGPIIRPHITRLVITHNDANGLLRTMPGAIQRAARSVLAATGQSDDDHDARVDYHRAHASYGAAFPYNRILSRNLWPLWASRAYAESMRLAGMLS